MTSACAALACGRIYVPVPEKINDPTMPSTAINAKILNMITTKPPMLRHTLLNVILLKFLALHPVQLIAMQLQHRRFQLPFQDQRRDILRTLHRMRYKFRLFAARRIQHIVGDIRPLSGMPYSDAQAPEITRTEVRDDVFQTVVPAMPTTQFQLGATGWQIKFIMHYEYMLRIYLVELRQRPHRTPADIHEGLRLEQKKFASLYMTACSQTVKLALRLEAELVHPRKLVHPPESGVVARSVIFTPGIAQTNDQFNFVHQVLHHEKSPRCNPG